MNNNLDGYTSEITYIYNYYTHWNFSRLRLASISRNIEPPKIFNACELGFGQGITLNILASSSNVNWYGTDFNKEQFQYANNISKKLKNNSKLYNYSFEEFAQQKDLPKFDLIVLHGIFSWVNKNNQDILIEFIHKNLSENGMVYISYNTKPGSFAFNPTRHLMKEVKKRIPNHITDIKEKMRFTISWLEAFHKTNPIYLDEYKGILTRFEEFKNKDISYLIHEYFNDDWTCFYFSEISEKLAHNGLKYLGQSNYKYDLQDINYTKEQINFLRNLPSPLKEDTEDTITLRSFRQDLWIKNHKPLNKDNLTAFIKTQKVILNTPLNKINLELNGKKYKLNLDSDSFNQTISILSNFRPKTLVEIKNKLNLSDKEILEITLLLYECGILALVQDEKIIEMSLQKCKNYNNIVLEDSLNEFNLKHLASPVTGDVITSYDRSFFIFVKAYNDGIVESNKLVQIVVEFYLENNLTVMFKNTQYKTDDELTQYFTNLLEKFNCNLLPLLKALKIL